MKSEIELQSKLKLAYFPLILDGTHASAHLMAIESASQWIQNAPEEEGSEHLAEL